MRRDNRRLGQCSGMTPERPAILASVQGDYGVAGWSRSRAESFSGQGD